METMEVGILIFAMFVVASITLCTLELIENTRLKRFYKRLKPGDVFADPWYSKNPFQPRIKVLKVLDKKDNYIKYEILWYDRETKSCIEKYDDPGSRSLRSFYYEFKNYKITDIND